MDWVDWVAVQKRNCAAENVLLKIVVGEVRVKVCENRKSIGSRKRGRGPCGPRPSLP